MYCGLGFRGFKSTLRCGRSCPLLAQGKWGGKADRRFSTSDSPGLAFPAHPLLHWETATPPWPLRTEPQGATIKTGLLPPRAGLSVRCCKAVILPLNGESGFAPRPDPLCPRPCHSPGFEGGSQGAWCVGSKMSQQTNRILAAGPSGAPGGDLRCAWGLNFPRNGCSSSSNGPKNFLHD